MTKASHILKAFSIIGPEEILKLSESVATGHGKMVSGDSFLVWGEEQEPEASTPEPDQSKDAEVIPFPKNKKHFEALVETAPEAPVDEKPIPSFVGGELALMQRELAKESEEAISRMTAKSGYKAATNLFVIKSKDLEGKSKIRFAATNGVLVDKKQA